MKDDPSAHDKGRLLHFRHRRSSDMRSEQTPVEDLAKYEGGKDPDDYRHRMVVNVAAFAFVIVLIGVGIWLADTMAAMRKNQDCVLSGRRGCTPVEFNRDRW